MLSRKDTHSMFKRGSGILMHIASLPSPYGIGTFGKEAYDFVDFLVGAGQKYWQILPLGPTSYGDSPYQSFSSHAINPYFIDFDLLQEEGLLEKSEYDSLDFGDDSTLVDYFKLYQNRMKVLKLAYFRAKQKYNNAIIEFSNQNKSWIDDYAMYMALKVHFELKEWSLWDDDIKHREPEAIERYKWILGEEIFFWKFTQLIGFRQWEKLKKTANQKGISIIGDIPIYAAYDSADTWAHAASGIFKFDKDLKPLAVAGCPPDYFSPDGQYWGNPVYNWAKNKETNYVWWMDRLKTSFELYDIVRIDHFRGFVSYWEIPYGSPTAASGAWAPGPKYDFTDAIQEKFGGLAIIAEDLGFLTEEVTQFNKDSGYPGMKILQFAFDAGGESSYLPHCYERNCIVYTGTHDNDTTLGWFSQASDEEKELAIKYLKLDEKEGYHWGMIRGALGSVANMAIFPMQDLLGLDSEARMNTPSTLGGRNWRWRINTNTNVTLQDLEEKMGELTKRYSR